MDKKRLVDKLESAGIVIVITMLIWLYAEGQAVSSDTVSVQVRFVGPEGQSVRVDPSDTQSFNVEFTGSRAVSDRFRRAAAGETYEIELTPNAGDPRQFVDIRDRLVATELGQIGVNITDVDPDTVPVTVEPMRPLDMRVEVESPDAAYSVPPTAEPAEVRVLVPDSMRDQAEQLTLTARLGSVDNREVDVRQEIDEVPVRLPDVLQGEAELLTDTVMVVFTLAENEEEFDLDPVFVWVFGPPEVHNTYRFGLSERTISGLRVRGPVESIEQLQDGSFTPHAILEVTNEALAGLSGPQSWSIVKFDLPEGVEVIEPALPLTFQISVSTRQNGANEQP